MLYSKFKLTIMLNHPSEITVIIGTVFQRLLLTIKTRVIVFGLKIVVIDVENFRNVNFATLVHVIIGHQCFLIRRGLKHVKVNREPPLTQIAFQLSNQLPALYTYLKNSFKGIFGCRSPSQIRHVYNTVVGLLIIRP